MKQLIIAEKPSVAADIAKSLGGFKRVDANSWESDTAVVSSAVGHLIEISADEDEKDRFDMSKLPVLPDPFKLSPVARTKDKLIVLQALLKRSDVSEVVNACDAGREGELIFRYIYHYAKCKKPIKRMWLQSMTAAAIKKSYADMQPGAKYENLYDAAVSRSEADWLVGINASRVLSLKQKQITGSWTTYSAGRVQTPTLALIVDRELQIKSFVPKDFWELIGTFKTSAGDYKGKWYSSTATKDEPYRLYDDKTATALLAKLTGKPVSKVEEDSKPLKKYAPPLYDLTSLQRDANTKFGLSAQETLQIAQDLYEKHKVLTYPRTDSTHLPSDYVDTAKELMEALKAVYPIAEKPITNKWIVPNKAIFDDEKISDHFAIIPTGHFSTLSTNEQKVFEMVSKRFIAVFFPPAEYTQTKRNTWIDTECFKSEGKVLLAEGWQAVYGKVSSEEEEAALIPLDAGKKPTVVKVEKIAGKTKPPARFTEATLLSAMEHAGKLVTDASLKEALKERGLGTPATRASIIEGLLSEKKNYLVRNKKELVPTEKGIALIQKLHEIKIDALTQAELTGAWEHKLKLMEQGKYTRLTFMQEISKMTQELVENVKADTSAAMVEGTGRPCPCCGKKTLDNDKLIKCSCGFTFWKSVAGKKISDKYIDELFAKKKTSLIDGFSSKEGKKFSAYLKLDGVKVSFDFTAETSLTDIDCPVCGKLLSGDDKKLSCSCGFSIWKSVAGKTLTLPQLATILSGKQSATIEGFTSKAGAKFSAALKLNADNKFEFVFASETKTSLGPLKAPCPACGGVVESNAKAYSCSCGFKVWKEMAKRQLTEKEVETLLKTKKTDKLEGFISKTGKPFAAALKLEDNQVKFDF